MPPAQLSIRASSGQYRAIHAPLKWDDIPDVSILTGANGSGKTQLLEAIKSAAHGSSKHKDNTLAMRFVPGPLELRSVCHIPDSFSLNVDAHTLAQAYGRVGEALESGKLDSLEPELRNAVQSTAARLGLDSTRMSDPEISQLIEALPLSASLSSCESTAHIIRNVSKAFLAYEGIRLTSQKGGKALEEIVREHGESPWDIANGLLRKVNFRYELQEPSTVFRPYQLECRGPSGLRVRLENLSSGERRVLLLTGLLLAGQFRGMIPQLLLLDEFDAHLHPETIPTFLGLLREFASTLGVRTILASHRVDTIAAAGDIPVFELCRTDSSPKRCESPSVAVSRLTRGRLSVVAGSRLVFVEDADDEEFHTAAYAIASEAGALGPFRGAALQFVSASAGKGNQATTGGRGRVKTLVRAAGEDGAIFGLVDGDGLNEADLPAHLFSLPRYCLENFLLDPLNIFCWAIENCIALSRLASPSPRRSGSKVPECWKPKDEGLIANLDREALQQIVDSIATALFGPESGDGPADKIRYFPSSHILSVPHSFLRESGKSQLRARLKKYGRVPDQKSLLPAYSRLGMIPEDLAKVYRGLERGEPEP